MLHLFHLLSEKWDWVISWVVVRLSGFVNVYDSWVQKEDTSFPCKRKTVFLFTYVKNWETLVELSSAKFGILWLLVLVILLLVYC